MSCIGPNVRLPSLEGLSDRKFKFCEAYLNNGMNRIEAARTAGYCAVSNDTLAAAALRNMKDKTVIRYIEKRLNKMQKETQLDLNYKSRKLKKVIDIGIPDDAEVLDPDMTKIAISAIEEHNKMVGDIAPTKNANLNCNVELDQFILEISNKALKEY